MVKFNILQLKPLDNFTVNLCVIKKGIFPRNNYWNSSGFDLCLQHRKNVFFIYLLLLLRFKINFEWVG